MATMAGPASAADSGTAAIGVPQGQYTLMMSGQQGEYVSGGGIMYVDAVPYSGISGQFLAYRRSNGVSVTVDRYRDGAYLDQWGIIIDAPTGQQFAAGATYEFSKTSGGMIMARGAGCACGAVGRATIKDVAYLPSGALSSLYAVFEQHCEGWDRPALTGLVRYNYRPSYFTYKTGSTSRDYREDPDTSWAQRAGTFAATVDGRETVLDVRGGTEAVQFRITPTRLMDTFIAPMQYATAGGARNYTAAMKIAVTGGTCGQPVGVLDLQEYQVVDGVVLALRGSYNIACDNGTNYTGSFGYFL